MRWLGLTVGLLGVSLCLLGWVYLRDREPSGWRPPEAQAARVDARIALAALEGPRCPHGCHAQVLGRVQPEYWLVRITLRGRPQCLQLDLDTFAIGQYGLVGTQPSRCQAPRRR
jgi:hypothetical protein